MIIQGHFIGDVPSFPARVCIGKRRAPVWFLADTGASRTLLLDRDAKLLGLTSSDLEPASEVVVGIGGSTRPLLARRTEIQFTSSEGVEIPWPLNLMVLLRDVRGTRPEEMNHIRRLPSLLGRDVINGFRFVCDYMSGSVYLER